MTRETIDVNSFKGNYCTATAHLHVLLLLTLISILVSPPLVHAGAPAGSALEREATASFNRAEYDQVLQLWYSASPDATASKPLIRLAFQSALKLGRPEEALTLYQRLIPTGQPDDPALLRPLALSFLTSHIRDTQEHVTDRGLYNTG